MKGIRFWLRNHAGWVTDPSQPVACQITYYLRKRVSVTDELPVERPDLDNLSKPVLDCLKPERVRKKLVQEGVICDDAQITDLYVRKRYAKKKPKTVIKLWTIQTEQDESRDYPLQGLLELLPKQKISS